MAKYKQAKGVYPENLNLLVPEWIPELPAPLLGDHKWSYFSQGGEYFSIGFEGHGITEPNGCRDSRSPVWDIDTK